MPRNDEFSFDVFLSHNSQDKPRVRRLAEALRAAGLRVWFDEWVIQPGDDIYLAIERGLEVSRTLVLCLSPAALGSDWVTLERGTSLFRDPLNKARRFLPLLLADCQLPDTLRRYKYVDYRNETEAALTQLLASCRPQEHVAAVRVVELPAREAPTPLKRKLMTEAEQWQCDDDEVRKNLPPGVKLVRTLRGHLDRIGRIAWSPDGRMLASPSKDKTIRLWDAKSGECLQELKGHTKEVRSVAFNGMGCLASASLDETIRLWEVSGGHILHILEGHEDGVNSVVFSQDGKTLFSGSRDGSVREWDVAKGIRRKILKLHVGHVNELVIDAQDGKLISVGDDERVQFWHNGIKHTVLFDRYILSVAFGSQYRILAIGTDNLVVIIQADYPRFERRLEGHNDWVAGTAFSSTGELTASKSYDGTLRIWNSLTGDCLSVIPEPSSGLWAPGLSFHPTLPILAAVGSDPDAPKNKREQLIHIYELDRSILLGQVAEQSAHYVNAKVVLVGDTGVGKSGLSLVLNNQSFEATDSTPGRRVWTLDSREVEVGNSIKQTRETLLWDLAGQPGYRVIHQLHLNEVAVALVVFDARSETDPLAGVRHWERALRLAQQRQGAACVPMKKFLVSARNDRGGVSIGKDRLQALLKEFGFDGYFETSAKEGWQIKELRAAIEQAIEWENLPEVSSSRLFADIKAFLLDAKKTGLLLAQPSQLYDEFARQRPDTAAKVANLRDQFDTCIGRLENRDLIRRLSFGGYVLLQPELLDAYASAMVNTAKEEPDGLGSMAEEIALAGKFYVPDEQKVKDPGQEQLLLHATVEELVRHDLALRENADDGRYLVFPSQFNRDYEDAPEPKGKAVAITFDGPVQSLYSTLAVRLGHSGLFTTGRAEMWRNAAMFNTKAGGKCGLFLHEFAEGRGRLILFFDEQASAETRFHFEEFVLAHTHRRALDNSVELVRFFVCANSHPVPDEYVKLLRAQGKTEFNCPCGSVVSLAEPKERLHFRSQVEAMDKSADRQRDFDAFVMSAKGETSTASFHEWAGGARVTLAIVFTDVVGSTALGEAIRDEAMNEVRRAHFAQSRKLIDRCQGREIKTIGDSFMAAFKSVDAALDYACALQKDTGHRQVQVRAGIHIGPLHVEESDVFGGTVNFAARVVGAVSDAEIWLSDRAKDDIDRLGAGKHKALQWERQPDVVLKGFPGKFTLWALRK